MGNSGRTGYLASEEEDVPIAVEETYGGNYVVCFDSLDGSSNIDAGISVGSIFVFEPSEQCLVEDRHVVTDSVEGDLTDEAKETLLYCCQPGRDLLSAGYVMYSSSTVLVLSVGYGVVGFTLDNLIGDFVMTHADIKIPETGKIYSFNEGNAANWSEGLKNYVPRQGPRGRGQQPLLGPLHRLPRGRLPPHDAVRGHLRLPGRQEERQREAPPHLRVRPHELPGGAGRRRGLHRRRPRPGPAARGCAPALPALHRLQEGGREA